MAALVIPYPIQVIMNQDPEEQLSPGEAAEKLRLLLAKVEQRIPDTTLTEATPDRGRKKLTIGMATYDDYDGVYFTMQAIRLYHPEVQDEIELLVIDNHPEGIASKALKDLDGWIPNYRYIPYRAWRGTAVRDLIFREANAEYVMSVDAHVFIAPGALRQLIDYFDAHPETPDLLQGPLIYDDLTTISTHFEPGWRSAMYGTWGTDERGLDPAAEPFEIPMQGLGLFACRRDAWQGFNPRLRGFGGEEGYIHEKFRRAGGRVVCLPFLRWLHRFGRPSGVPYRLKYLDRIRNYLLGWRELNLDETDIVNHFKKALGPSVEAEISQAQTEVNNPFCLFDAVYCINLDEQADRWQSMERRFAHLGIDWLVRRFSAIKTPASHHIGCALSHRQIIAEAKKHGLKHVLVFEDDAIFHRDTLHFLALAVEELKQQTWELFYLGGYRWGEKFRLAPGCEYLETVKLMSCTHAVAYHHTIYDRILADLPTDEGAMTTWLQDHAGIDQYLAYLDIDKYITRPALATQPFLASKEDPTYRDRFVI